MRRRLFNLAAAVSLVLCVSAVAMWVRSHYRFDNICYGSRLDPRVGQRFWYLSSGSGYLCYHRDFSSVPRWTAGWSVTASPIAGLPVDLPSIVRTSGREWHGFGYLSRESVTRGATPQTRRWFALLAPHWSVFALFTSLPLWWTCLYGRKLYRRRCGRCPRCGYDLRATPDRCPECGAEAKHLHPSAGATA